MAATAQQRRKHQSKHHQIENCQIVENGSIAINVRAPKDSNSSNETVIAARLVQVADQSSTSSVSSISSLKLSSDASKMDETTKVSTHSNGSLHRNEMENSNGPATKKPGNANKLKNLLIYTTHHLNPFNSNSTTTQQTASNQANHNQSSQPIDDKLADDLRSTTTGAARQTRGYLSLLNLLQKYLWRQSSMEMQSSTNEKNHFNISRSAPVTPVHRSSKASQLDNTTLNCKEQQSSEAGGGQRQPTPKRPSVRFVENSIDHLRRSNEASFYTADCAVQTGDTSSFDFDVAAAPDESSLVAKLFKLQEDSTQKGDAGEVPMDSSKFKSYGYKLIDYICNYLDTIDERRVTPLNIEPGYLKTLIQPDAPEQGEPFARIMHDFDKQIMCGITHWQHPHFHAYFPAGNAYPSILADMLSDALGCVGFSWAASPAYTELEIIMLDWMGKMIGLPDEFLCLSGNRNQNGSGTGEGSKGGGVIQGSASECVLVNLLAARHWAIDRLRKKHPGTPDGALLSKLIGYCSKEAHSCVEKAAMIGFIRMRALDTDEKHSLRGETLAKAIEADIKNGLEPFIVCATLGTTSCVSFDNLQELGQVCKQYNDIWLHVDAAYAGSALICPEFKYLMKGIEMATSFNMNPNKWMLINFDCSLMWVKDRFKLTRAFVVDPLYLQHSYSDQAIDYRHWGIPLSRRFRALKLWFVIRNYGITGLQAYIRNHVKLAKLFESLIRQDSRFSITNEVVLGLVCFRLIGSNALNQRLLSMINASGKLHMVPASLNGRYVIRFCVCDQHASEKDIHYAYECISDFATELLDLIRAGKERIRAISQQNTIDVSSISLHTQQSASADKLNSMADAQQVPIGASVAHSDAIVAPSAAASNCPASSSSSSSSHRVSPNSNPSSKSPLLKQASFQPTSAQTGHTPVEPEEDLEQEVALNSLATIVGFGLDEDDENGIDDEYDYNTDEPLIDAAANYGLATSETSATTLSGQESQKTNQRDSSDSNNSMANNSSTSERKRWQARASRAARVRSGTMVNQSGNDAEADDELATLAERRHRMSLRYKREFFVRVVSDPRVYRASISGDINAHASSCSLADSHQQVNCVGQTQANSTSK